MEYALIVAGGKGTRIKSDVPKQFLEVAGLPVLMHTINAFFRYSDAIRVVLVLPEDDFNTWEVLCKKYSFTKPVTLQKGGDSRFQSVKNGLTKIQGEGLVAIHDGVRPLVKERIIELSFKLAAVNQSAIAAVQLKDSIRRVDKEITQSVDRNCFRLIQTPQTFDVALIKKAYQSTEDVSLTDDAAVAERAGCVVSLFDGSYENIKITTAEDLIVAEALLVGRKVIVDG